MENTKAQYIAPRHGLKVGDKVVDKNTMEPAGVVVDLVHEGHVVVDNDGRRMLWCHWELTKAQTEPVTPSSAKKAVKESLGRNGITFSKLSAKTVSFEDLARGSRIFVTVHGLTLPDPRLSAVATDSKNAGVSVNFKGVWADLGVPVDG